MNPNDKTFAGSIPKLYETLLVPLIFQPYADDLAQRLRAAAPKQILEVAAGTGVVTRAVAEALPGAQITATDLNQAMLDEARANSPPHVTWQEADALALPFADASFDAVVCQFGVMFFPDKPRAFAEARRVLKPGGLYVFNVWDRIEENLFAKIVTDALAGLFPQDPPRFLARTPHGYCDEAQITRDLAAGGLTAPRFDLLAAESRAASARIPAVAYCEGTPLRGEIEARSPGRLAQATAAAEAALVSRLGRGSVTGKIQARVIAVKK